MLVIIALVKQHQSDMNGALRALTWITLGYVCLGFVIGYVLYSIIAFKNPDIMNNQWEMIKAISAMSPWDNPFMMSIYIFFICSSLILGISGLILLNKFRTSIYDL